MNLKLTIKTEPDFMTKTHGYETINPTNKDLENNLSYLCNYRKALMGFLINTKVGDEIGLVEWGTRKKRNTSHVFSLNHTKHINVTTELHNIEEEIFRISSLIK